MVPKERGEKPNLKKMAYRRKSTYSSRLKLNKNETKQLGPQTASQVPYDVSLLGPAEFPVMEYEHVYIDDMKLCISGESMNSESKVCLPSMTFTATIAVLGIILLVSMIISMSLCVRHRNIKNNSSIVKLAVPQSEFVRRPMTGFP